MKQFWLQTDMFADYKVICEKKKKKKKVQADAIFTCLLMCNGQKLSSEAISQPLMAAHK